MGWASDLYDYIVQPRQVCLYRLVQWCHILRDGDYKTAYNGVFADSKAFNKKVRTLFIGIGSEENFGAQKMSDTLTALGIKNTFYESPGTAHEWLTWRRCLKEFLPLLFKK